VTSWRWLEATLQWMEVELGPDDPDMLNSRSNLPLGYGSTGRLTSARVGPTFMRYYA
jgi:hypothetical protein